MNYRVLQTIWHTAERRHVYPDEVTSLNHLDDETRAWLVELGVVEETALDVSSAQQTGQEESVWQP